VFSVALRQTAGDHALAQDVTQMVFIDLARKAAALARHPTLLGWLHRATCFGVARVRRAEARRRTRELAAHSPEGTLGESGLAIDWSRLQPVFDDVLGTLKERDRAALLLRYFEGRSLAEVGATLSVTETAARSCIDRALEKMRVALARRGVDSTAAALGLALTQQTGVAAPAGLAGVVTGAALAKTAAGGAAGMLSFFAMTKLQIGTAVLLLTLGAASVTWERWQTHALATEVKALRAQHATIIAGQADRRSEAEAAAAAAGSSRMPVRAARASPDSAENKNAGLVAAGMKPMSDWRNAGRATPEAAFETFLWAAFNGNADTLMRTYAFAPSAKAKLDAWFLTLPPGVQAKFGAPERLIAPVVAEDDVWLTRLRITAKASRRDVGFKIVRAAAPDRGGTVMLQVLFSFSPDADRPSRIPMWEAADGWRYGRAGDSMVDLFTARIDPATGEMRPRPEAPKASSR
jgi:RNA polymerase sigma factor (sigma-70 family)